MEFKGTTGEWSFRHIDIVDWKKLMVFSNERKLIVAELFSSDGHYEKFTPEDIANAKLISAAPDLLKELEFFRNVFKNTIGVQNYEPNVFQKLNEAYIRSGEAIKKALD